MHPFLSAACEIVGLRCIPTDRQISAWLRSISREDRAALEAAEDRTIEDATDGATAVAAVEREALVVAPLILRAQFGRFNP
jgi:hypothetical protein